MIGNLREALRIAAANRDTAYKWVPLTVEQRVYFTRVRIFGYTFIRSRYL